MFSLPYVTSSALMSDPTDLLKRNRAWADQLKQEDPEFFQRLAKAQEPKYLWIGCADSRVPANQILGLVPGEIFVHRNVANVVVHSDLNCLSVLQFAVEVLKVEHVLVVGHYGCGGVAAALANRRLGLIDNWLRHIQDIRLKHSVLIDAHAEEGRADLLCELNVIEQVVNVCQTTIVQDAWERGQALNVHGWTYALQDGLMQDLKMSVSGPGEVATAYQSALENLR
ncbi:Carbonate dehydratase [Chthoniobacter flavus Ellin428]|uniref:Carbonic anhydrase n=2 Tax=Chthoniobacter flavus TaxID=191863 RepID=B4D3R7_9BACT|nr:Carbonate dehydratase [Chthoniobacter flavus Ellin428]TCO93487.1 carbonic anhydrase [Chthoniobacter flavus]